MSDSIVVSYLRTRASDGRACGVLYDIGLTSARMPSDEELKEKKEREEAWEKREHKMTVIALAEKFAVEQDCPFDAAITRAEIFIEKATAWMNKE